jgi:alkanesulfonate monooxygenase SsuD/methylene tetrahydromethanopterin reductase-like flavin-dependent oxidoreductase (luciferase family)
LIAELPCALTTDRDALHAMAASDLAIYPQMPNYRALFKAAGVPLDKGRWTDEMLDAAVLHGDEDGIAHKIQALFDAGADEVAVSPFGVGDDPAGSLDDCIRVLSDIARG